MAVRPDDDITKLITSQQPERPGANQSETPADDIEALAKWVENCTKISILAAGKAGAGKSTLLNAITGENIFEVGKNRAAAGTTTITPHTFVKNGVTVTVWDSPGFQDDSGKEEEYKTGMRTNCSNVDLLMYCVSIKDPKSDINQDRSAFKQITDALTKDIWKRSIVVLTFTNMVEGRLKLTSKGNLEQSLQEKIDQWKSKIQEALREAQVNESIIEKVRVIPAGHAKKPHLAGHKLWLSKLWLACAQVTSEEARIALSKVNKDRFTTSDKVTPDDFKKPIEKQPLVIDSDTVVATVGAVGAIAGVAIGATTGALIGGLVLGVPTFGVATGVGVALGLVIGGGLGVGTAGGLAKIVQKIRQKDTSKDEDKVTETDVD